MPWQVVGWFFHWDILVTFFWDILITQTFLSFVSQLHLSSPWQCSLANIFRHLDQNDWTFYSHFGLWLNNRFTVIRLRNSLSAYCNNQSWCLCWEIFNDWWELNAHVIYICVPSNFCRIIFSSLQKWTARAQARLWKTFQQTRKCHPAQIALTVS